MWHFEHWPAISSDQYILIDRREQEMPLPLKPISNKYQMGNFNYNQRFSVHRNEKKNL